jgi:hypothetical protein
VHARVQRHLEPASAGVDREKVEVGVELPRQRHRDRSLPGERRDGRATQQQAAAPQVEHGTHRDQFVAEHDLRQTAVAELRGERQVHRRHFDLCAGEARQVGGVDPAARAARVAGNAGGAAR